MRYVGWYVKISVKYYSWLLVGVVGIENVQEECQWYVNYEGLGF